MRLRLEKVALVAAMALASLNVWTGAPLFGVWVGSRATGGGQISMLAVLVIVLAIGATAYALLWVLAHLGARYDNLTGRTPTVRKHTPWLRSMSGERPTNQGNRAQLTALEYILVTSVVLAVAAFEFWFFFKAGSPFDQRTGRN